MAVAVSAIATAVGAWGTAAFIGAAATAAMETGLALTVIGAATGSKDLMKAGSVLGLVGGATGLAAGAGMFGEEVASAAGGWATGSSAATEATGAGAGATTSPVASSTVVGTPLSEAGTGLLENGAATAAQANPMTGLAADQTALETGQAIGGGQALATDPAEFARMDALSPNAATVAPTEAAYAPNPVPPGGDPTGGQIGTGLQAGDTGSLYSNAGYGNSTQMSLGEKLMKEGADWWKGLDKMSQAMILKSAMAIPGGIQAQANKAKELALMQQRVNQTSYGSQVPTFGLINQVRGA